MAVVHGLMRASGKLATQSWNFQPTLQQRDEEQSRNHTFGRWTSLLAGTRLFPELGGVHVFTIELTATKWFSRHRFSVARFGKPTETAGSVECGRLPPRRVAQAPPRSQRFPSESKSQALGNVAETKQDCGLSVLSAHRAR